MVTLETIDIFYLFFGECSYADAVNSVKHMYSLHFY
jgi:hypothetical protein